ncbi:MAG: hypothetical protein ACRC8P_00765 [Spiroplasma sp.]
MRSILKILSISSVIGITFLSVVASTNVSNNDRQLSNQVAKKYVSKKISFKDILSISPDWYEEKIQGFMIYENDVLCNSDLPANMWGGNEHSINGKFAYFYVNDSVWNQIALIYGINDNSTHKEIAKLMDETPIVNVYMTISFVEKGKWKLLKLKGKNLHSYATKIIAKNKTNKIIK